MLVQHLRERQHALPPEEDGEMGENVNKVDDNGMRAAMSPHTEVPSMTSKAVAVLVLLLVTGNALGQDFKKVIEIVDEMETSLKVMISREQTERKNEIASLRSEVLALRQSLVAVPHADRSDNAAVASASVEDLARRMDILEKRISGVPQNADLSQLTGQLNTLVAELKKVITEKPPIAAQQVKPPQTAPAPSGITYQISGQIRDRGEMDGRSFVPEARTLGYNLLRSRVGVMVKPSDDVQAFIQIQDSRTWGGGNPALARGTTDGTAKALDFHQAYLGVANMFSSGLSLKLGRQEMSYGNERLVSPSNWGNTARSFDAAKVSYESEMYTVHLFTAKLVGSQTVVAAENFHGMYATMRNLKPLLADLVYLLDDNTTELTKGPEIGASKLSRATAGLRLYAKSAPWDADVEFFHQYGHISLIETDARNKISADLYSMNAGVTVDASLKMRVGVVYTMLSGDNDAKDGSYRSFNTVFGSGHTYYGFMDLFPKVLGEYGLHDAILSWAATPYEPLSLALDLHHFRLDRGAMFKDPTTGQFTEAKALGQEIDLTVNYKYSPIVTFTLGLSAFVPGEAMQYKQGPATSYWGFLATTVNF